MGTNLNALVSLYNNIDVLLAVMARFFGFFLVVPVISGRNIPVMTRIGLAAAIGAIVFFSGNVTIPAYEPNLFGYAVVLMVEVIVGLIMGFVVFMMFSLFYFVGQLMDYQIGFSMVSVFDPVTQFQVPITGNLYYLLCTMMFVMTNGIEQLIQTVFYSYESLPLGQAQLLNNPNLPAVLMEMMVSFFVIGIKIALPMIATILVVDAALGILTKAVPQMNIFVVGMPLKLFIGLIVLYMIFPMFSSIYRYVYDMTLVYFYNIVKGMMSP